MAAADDPFLSRWSRRKAQARAGDAAPEPALTAPALATLPTVPAAGAAMPPVAVAEAVAPSETVAPAAPPPPPTLADVAELTGSSDFARFVTRDVAPDVKNAALKKLFTDPHFNIMDGLDTYIDDYGKPDPLPPGMLRQMVQSRLLGLFDDGPKQPQSTADPQLAPCPALAADATAAAPLPLPDPIAHEDPDLQLQPDDAAGCRRPDAGAEPDAGRQH